MNDGFLLLNKPRGITSRDLVNEVGKKLGTKKVGHLGTLDPMAEGLMIIAVGKALRVSYLLEGLDKEYTASAEFGFETDTLDAEGQVLRKEEYFITKDILEQVLSSFNKTYLQEVPIYSAKKVKGKKLYEYARKGIKVDLPTTKVTISNLKLLEFSDKEFTFSVKVTSGTYIRSLIRDIGKNLGIPMTMTSLIRTSQGPFKLKDATALDDLKFIDMKIAASGKNKVSGEDLINDIKHGKVLKDLYGKDPVFVDKNGNILAIYESYKPGYIKPKKVLIDDKEII